MKTLQIDETKARILYKTASPEFKQSLEDTFGKKYFTGEITDRIKTYEDACAELCETPINEKDLKANGFTVVEIIRRKLETITKALNEDWKADLYDTDQYKYYGWFNLSSGGFVFRRTDYDSTYANAGVGSRLCFKSSVLAEYAGKQFIDYYKIIAEN
jgi:hypothetical protein